MMQAAFLDEVRVNIAPVSLLDSGCLVADLQEPQACPCSEAELANRWRPGDLQVSVAARRVMIEIGRSDT